MHLFHVIPVLGLLLRARASSFDLREPAPHRLDVRDTSDTCATVNGKFSYNVQGDQDKVENIFLEGICECLSDIPSILEEFGISGLLAEQTLTSLISNAAAASGCNYPENSTPSCSSDDDVKPCDFTCFEGFSPSPPDKPTTCVCTAPNVICNGQCVAQGACPSSQPMADKKRRSWVGSGSCTDMGPGWVACGVLGAGPRAWECVNAGRDLESCGGCMVPLTAYSPVGKDCSALPGVADVSCLGGECVVDRCLPGYVPARDGTSCIRKYQIPQSQLSYAESVPARVYGLEHDPLGWN